MLKKFEDLDVYQLAFEMTTDVYRSTAGFPNDECFGLINQIRRAAVSVISNIAEGSMRLYSAEFRQFIGIARGSVGELRCQSKLSESLSFLARSDFQKITAQLESVGKMLTNLTKALLKKQSR